MKLHFTTYGHGSQTLVILHGLLGSERNWYSVAKKLSQRYRLIIPDQRNHGISPHDAEHSVAAMCSDLERLCDELDLQKFALLGHSMGGHVAMAYAFRHPERLRCLIIEDIAPRSYEGGLVDILHAMAAVDLTAFEEKKQVEVALRSSIRNDAVRLFILTNLVREDHGLRWRVNIPALTEFAKNEISRFRASPADRYDGPTLFLGGEKSAYRLDADRDAIIRYFPRAELRMIPDAGHWIHHEAVDLFCEHVLQFLDGRF